MDYNHIAESTHSTVVAHYTPSPRNSSAYQSEAALEQEFINLLQDQGYSYLTIHTEEALISNLKTQLEALNNYQFSPSEWELFFKTHLANASETVNQKTKKIQSSHIIALKTDSGITKNIYLIDKDNIHNNSLQVINQYQDNDGLYKARYDVTILINGLPLVHIELKRRGVSLREAFNQIKRYQRYNFGSSNALFQYVQLYIISNGTLTKYYSNTTREQLYKENNSKASIKNTFEFTSFWADADNNHIADLVDFSKTFLSKHTLLNIISKYCVFTSQEQLLVMRPYQIAACEKIIKRIEISNNYKQFGTIKAGGYIWHTTGSGKTLTSFKTAQLACNLPYIDKVLFIVDRKDLDYQTMKEYDRFEKDSANSNKSTKILQSQLESDSNKIIITTIQKLGVFISKNKDHAIYHKHVVLIFDECHRSQFGEIDKSINAKIRKSFKKYHMFGFTGTPIFAKNASPNAKNPLCTTPQIFGGELDEQGQPTRPLHSYTIVSAISDENVLPFRIDYLNTMQEKSDIKDWQVLDIDREKAFASNERINQVVSYILEHFSQKTSHKTFNSIFAVSSIAMAKKYYEEFTKQLKDSSNPITFATIFSFCANEDNIDEDESFDTDSLDAPSREFLDYAIKNYNGQFSANYDTSADKFQNYYKDVSKKMKDKNLDLLIVVNMFLTGFDATSLNTLWVDKNLKYHGLLQAFSRTNRILNSLKKFGNIVSFRNLEEETNEAISLFGDNKAGSIVLLKTYDEYYNGYLDNDNQSQLGYADLIDKLLNKFPLPLNNSIIIGESIEENFIMLFGSILKLRNILMAFDQFNDDTKISERDLQDYQSFYLSLYEKRGGAKAIANSKENINSDIVFEIELIKQIEIKIDYILLLVLKYHEANCQNMDVLENISKSIDSSLSLRSKKELILNFINSLNPSSKVDDDWQEFVSEQKKLDLTNIIKKHKLKEVETFNLLSSAFRDGYLKTIGVDIDNILPSVSRFNNNEINRLQIKQQVIDELLIFFEKYTDV